MQGDAGLNGECCTLESVAMELGKFILCRLGETILHSDIRNIAPNGDDSYYLYHKYLDTHKMMMK